MAHAAAKQNPIDTPDWVDVYYSPDPANSSVAPKPELMALAQMFAYYDG